MKPYLFLILTGATLLCSTSSHAAGPPGSLGEGDGNNTNPHNLSSRSAGVIGKITADDETQICVFCHIPHGATPQSTLWNRPDPVTNPFPTFNTTIQNPNGVLGIADPSLVGRSEYGQGVYPNGASKLCLSCHDGVTAIGTLSNLDEFSVEGAFGTTMSGTSSNKYFGGSGALDLTKSHPISFIYLNDVNYLNDIATLTGTTYNFPSPNVVPLDGESRVQCTICHEPHQDTNDGSTYFLPFWRGATGNESADYDAICNACHAASYYPGINHNYP